MRDNRELAIYIKPNTYIFTVFLLFLIPLKWLLAWLLAICAHEFSHWIAVRVCGGKILSLNISVGGAKMDCASLSKGMQLAAILSGPIGGLIPVIFCRWIPRTALCCIVLSIYNLLPLRPLDGGNTLEIILGERSLLMAVEKCFLILAGVAAVYASFFLHLGWLPLLIVAGLWLRNRKIPCKVPPFKVQ